MTTGERAPRAALLLVLCLLLVACVYARAFDGPFIWDDRYLIADSESVRQGVVLQLFKQPFWLGPPGQAGSLSYYRPLTSLSFVVDFWLHGENASGFHLTNLLLHLLATGFVFGLLRQRQCEGRLAFLLTCVWALLPRLTEGAAWISGRGDVLAATFALAALWAYRPDSLARAWLAALLAFGALLSKESGIAVVLALVLLERGASARVRVVAPAAALLAYLALRTAAGATSLGDGAALSVSARALTSLEALGRYAWMLLDPLQPRSLLGQLGHLQWRYVGAGVASAVALLVGATRWRKSSTPTRAFAVLAFVPLALVLHLTPLPVTVVAADRYLYLPTAGLLLAAAPALQRRWGTKPAVLASLLLLLVACGVRTFQRVGDYADDARFWVEAVQTSPSDAIGLIELGSVAYRAGLFDAGLRLNQRALPLDIASRGQALDNAALMAMASGDRVLAAQLGDELVQRFPDRPGFRLRRASIALNARDFERAEAEARRAASAGFTAAERFLELVQRSRLPSVDPQLAQRQDIEALRYREVASRLEQLLKEPQASQPLIRSGVEFLILNGEPERARQLFQLYVQRFGADGTAGAADALAQRLERAQAIVERLAALDN
jgi:protein O-mannosyl-transferase